jgi:transcriptional regulator with XRE-family HTH domain
MGVSIAFWRRLRKKKQKELAKDCGWPAPRISRYETARAWPDEESIETLARKLEISPEDLRRTQKVLYDHELAVEGEAEAAATSNEEPPEEGVVRERPEEPSTDLARRWEELRNLEAEARVIRDQLEQETHEALFRSALAESKGP